MIASKKIIQYIQNNIDPSIDFLKLIQEDESANQSFDILQSWIDSQKVLSSLENEEQVNKSLLVILFAFCDSRISGCDFTQISNFFHTILSKQVFQGHEEKFGDALCISALSTIIVYSDITSDNIENSLKNCLLFSSSIFQQIFDKFPSSATEFQTKVFIKIGFGLFDYLCSLNDLTIDKKSEFFSYLSPYLNAAISLTKENPTFSTNIPELFKKWTITQFFYFYLSYISSIPPENPSIFMYLTSNISTFKDQFFLDGLKRLKTYLKKQQNRCIRTECTKFWVGHCLTLLQTRNIDNLFLFLLKFFNFCKTQDISEFIEQVLTLTTPEHFKTDKFLHFIIDHPKEIKQNISIINSLLKNPVEDFPEYCFTLQSLSMFTDLEIPNDLFTTIQVNKSRPEAILAFLWLIALYNPKAYSTFSTVISQRPSDINLLSLLVSLPYLVDDPYSLMQNIHLDSEPNILFQLEQNSWSTQNKSLFFCQNRLTPAPGTFSHFIVKNRIYSVYEDLSNSLGPFDTNIIIRDITGYAVIHVKELLTLNSEMPKLTPLPSPPPKQFTFEKIDLTGIEDAELEVEPIIEESISVNDSEGHHHKKRSRRNSHGTLEEVDHFAVEHPPSGEREKKGLPEIPHEKDKHKHHKQRSRDENQSIPAEISLPPFGPSDRQRPLVFDVLRSMSLLSVARIVPNSIDIQDKLAELDKAASVNEYNCAVYYFNKDSSSLIDQWDEDFVNQVLSKFSYNGHLALNIADINFVKQGENHICPFVLVITDSTTKPYKKSHHHSSKGEEKGRPNKGKGTKTECSSQIYITLNLIDDDLCKVEWEKRGNDKVAFDIGIAKENLVKTKYLCGYIVYIMSNTIIRTTDSLHTERRMELFPKILSEMNDMSLSPFEYLQKIYNEKFE